MEASLSDYKKILLIKLLLKFHVVKFSIVK